MEDCDTERRLKRKSCSFTAVVCWYSRNTLDRINGRPTSLIDSSFDLKYRTRFYRKPFFTAFELHLECNWITVVVGYVETPDVRWWESLHFTGRVDRGIRRVDQIENEKKNDFYEKKMHTKIPPIQLSLQSG